MKFTLIANGVHSIDWPIIEMFINGTSVGQREVHGYCELDFNVHLNQKQNFIRINYVNKKEHHTVLCQNNNIISDQYLELVDIRIDDILTDSWFLTEGHFYPSYFSGFLKTVTDAPTELKSQLIWHFPGSFVLPPVPNEKNFWFWYRDQRRYVHITTHADKDGHRDERYVGSLDPLTDLANEIKRIINV